MAGFQFLTVFNIVIVVLALVIIYFLIRVRLMLRKMPGARLDMNTIQLIKNWQEQKAKDAEYQNSLRQQAVAAARPEIEAALIEKYKKDEIARATADPKDAFKKSLKDGLGFDSDKAFSQANMDRMVGKSNVDLSSGVDSGVVFGRDKIAGMTNTGAINPAHIKEAAGSLNWRDGVKGGLQSETRFTGLNNALGRQPPQAPVQQPVEQKRRFR